MCLYQHCGLGRASHCRGFSCCWAWALRCWLWLMGVVAPWQVESSWSSDWTHVSCIGRQILNPWTTREVLSHTSWFPSTYQALGFSGGSDDKESAWDAKTQVQSLGREDPLEKGMTAHSSILVWKIPQTEEPGGLQSMWSQRVWHNWATNTFIDHQQLMSYSLFFTDSLKKKFLKYLLWKSCEDNQYRN